MRSSLQPAVQFRSQLIPPFPPRPPILPEKEPTIISPKQYMRRFRQAMQSYFTVVPAAADMEAFLDADA